MKDGFAADPERNVRFKEDCETGVHVFDGTWINWSTDWNGNYDLNYSYSKALEGPWDPRLRVLPHGGNGKLFEDKEHQFWYAYFNNTNDVGTRAGNYCRMNIYPVVAYRYKDEVILEPKALQPNRQRLEKLGALWQRSRN
jgi:hypothetical protein